ncbi:MAG TPA: HNH endonuclease signature motif containing protein [Mycobacterium sp.]|nr:HNH endonuclease signature motif containing protein [Mycobacterium sp.]
MRSNSREEIVERFDALSAALDAVLELDFAALTTPERLALLQRCETVRRRLPAVEHPLINQLATQTDAAELGGKPHWALADRLGITRGEAKRRIDEAAELGPRCTLQGQPLAPVLPATAAAQRTGHLGAGHVRVIRDFFNQLPDDIDVETRGRAEADLAAVGANHRPDELAKLATRLFDRLVPDGLFSDVERAKRRTLLLGHQDRDGMSSITGWLTPEARATLDAVLARWAAPGICNPGDETPCVGGTPSQAAIDNDTRSAGQRSHDALNALGRAMLASGDLGQHNGLPASIIVSVSLADLESGTGKAHTGGGSWLPMSDVLRLAGHAHHWLRIFDGAKELALFHTKRIASPAQRIVLYARDRGCTHPRCTVPAALTEVHHNEPFAKCRQTDIHDLTLKCHPHHEIITSGGWHTRTRGDGTIETIPPPHLDYGQPRINHYHHPERLLRESEDDDGP